MQDEVIHLSPYNPLWSQKFEKEKKLIEETLGNNISGGIHHVGSTSIPHLSAKPIIDIMVGVTNLEKAKANIPLLEKIGYCYYPYKPDLMIWFCKPSPEKREFHLYLIEPTTWEWKARLAFRDYLRTHTKEREEYEGLKQQLANRFSTNREEYTKAKSDFVRNISERALKV